MKKIILFIFMALPMMAAAQSTLTPQEELEKAQKQLEEAQKALNIAKANAAKAQQEAKARQEAEAKAKADAEAKAKTEAIRRKIDEMKKLPVCRRKRQKSTQRIQPRLRPQQSTLQYRQSQNGTRLWASRMPLRTNRTQPSPNKTRPRALQRHKSPLLQRKREDSHPSCTHRR